MTLVDERPVTISSIPAAVPRARTRDRYIDCLRAAALVRVVIYHIFGWVWLPALFPSMGIMFALAGSLVASSLDRSPGKPWRVLAKRTRRLLPPLWLMGVILVPIMVWYGWTFTDTVGSPLHWRTILLWVFPISDPPGSAWGDDFVVPLWYIRAYLWFLLLSPALLWMFRRWPKRVLVAPLIVLGLGTLGVLDFSGRTGDVILTMSIFGACWMIGFAHHDNRLRDISLRKIVPLGLTLLVAGLVWALTHQDPQTSWDMDNIPMADALYGLGAVVLLLRFYPDFSWVSRRPVLDRLVTGINLRAMTIYLWNNVAIFCTTLVAGLWSVTAAWDTGGAAGRIQQFVLTWLLIGVAILLFGWVEDIAARRPIQINPWRRSQRDAPRARLTFPQPTVFLKPAYLLIGTACLVGVAAAVSLLSLRGTHTPGRTAVIDVAPNTPWHPRLPRPRPANLAQPNAVTVGVVPGRQNTGGTNPVRPDVVPAPRQTPSFGLIPAPSAPSRSIAPTPGPPPRPAARLTPVAPPAPSAKPVPSVVRVTPTVTPAPPVVRVTPTPPVVRVTPTVTPAPPVVRVTPTPPVTSVTRAPSTSPVTPVPSATPARLLPQVTTTTRSTPTTPAST